jgi:hypothetical protein
MAVQLEQLGGRIEHPILNPVHSSLRSVHRSVFVTFVVKFMHSKIRLNRMIPILNPVR